MTRPYRRPTSKPSRAFGIGFALWFAFCGLLGIAVVGAVLWLIVAAISWINRQP